MSRPDSAWNYVYTNLQQTGAAADEAIWTPSSGKALMILKIVVSVSADALVQVTEGADAAGTRIVDAYLLASDPLVLDFHPDAPLNLAADAVLSLTHGAVNSKVSVLGVEV